jgi:hypothetical protein
VSEREHIIHQIGFQRGVIEGVIEFAIWRNGEQLVGCMERPLKEVLKPYKDKLAELTSKLEDAAERTK